MVIDSRPFTAFPYGSRGNGMTNVPVVSIRGQSIVSLVIKGILTSTKVVCFLLMFICRVSDLCINIYK